MDDLIDDEEDTGEQDESSIKKRNPNDWLRPWQYKPGQSGNPSGRAKGISLKEYVKVKFAEMTPEEREEFLKGLNKDKIWEMAEGRAEAKTDVNLKGDLIVKVISFDEGNNNTPQPEAGQK